MLLRWLVNQYLRDAAEGKVRDLVADLVKPRGQGPEAESPAAGESPSQEPGPGPVPKGVVAEDDFVPCDIAFLFALGIESGGLLDHLKGAERSRHKHGLEHAGRLAGREVVVVEADVGAKAAARATAAAIEFYQPRWVVSAGFAGGLTDELRRGHVVMADEVASCNGERLAVGIKLDPATIAATRGLHVGRLLTVDGIIRQPADRHRLAAEHGAIACDMETYGVAEVCKQRGVKLLSVRIISDAVDDELPPEVEHLLKQKSLAGKIGAAAGAVFSRPSAAKDFWRLREDALKASDRLAKFLVGVVEQLPTNDQ